jgi:hypothetical protein
LKRCRSADPEGGAIRKKALNDWLEKNARSPKRWTIASRKWCLAFHRQAVSTTPSGPREIKAILLEEIFRENMTSLECEMENGMPHTPMLPVKEHAGQRQVLSEARIQCGDEEILGLGHASLMSAASCDQ